MMRIGIVGHRYLTPEQAAFVAGNCIIIFKNLLAEHRSPAAFSAVAEGADSIFAEEALRLGMPLEIVIPFAAYAADFLTKESQGIYRHLLAAAKAKTILPFAERSEDAYVDAMQWILQKSDIIVAVWNGDVNGGRGGTADAVQKIISTEQDWIHIDISNFSVKTYIRKKA